MPESKQECLQARLADSDSEVDNKFKRKMQVAQEKPVEKQKTARPPDSSPRTAAGTTACSDWERRDLGVRVFSLQSSRTTVYSDWERRCLGIETSKGKF